MAALLAPLFTGAQESSPTGSPPREQTTAANPSLDVLILGDSMALCGFGKRLDDRFRSHPDVKSTFSYMACGTTPVTWLKEKPYTGIKTRCGFWSIESVAGSKQPKSVQDTYGMDRGGPPKAHDVPKLEDLLASTRPSVLVMQNENNLFGVFAGRTKLQPERDGPAVRRYISPFVAKMLRTPSPLRRVYWIGSPVSGRVPAEIQDFVLEQIRVAVGPMATVIDSRTLIPYPYRHMEPDHEHFQGPEMDQWADRVFETIERDLEAHPLASLTPLNELAATAAAAAELKKKAEPPKEQPLLVSAKLVSKSTPIALPNLLPYQESLATFVYDIRKVTRGAYAEKQILVAHPACIGLKMQPLEKFKIGKTYNLRLRPLRSSVWNNAKCRDDSGLINLEPYIATEDEARYPGTAR